LFTVKDWRYALYQIISIGLIVVVVFYPALVSIAHETFAPIVYSFTGVLLFLFLFGWWEIIDWREVRRSVREESEMEMEKERVRIDEPKKDKLEDINLYRDEVDEKLKRLRSTVISGKK
jgi:amino acid permease